MKFRSFDVIGKMLSLAGIGVSRDSRVQEKVGDEPGNVDWSSAEVA